MLNVFGKVSKFCFSPLTRILSKLYLAASLISSVPTYIFYITAGEKSSTQSLNDYFRTHPNHFAPEMLEGLNLDDQDIRVFNDSVQSSIYRAGLRGSSAINFSLESDNFLRTGITALNEFLYTPFSLFFEIKSYHKQGDSDAKAESYDDGETCYITPPKKNVSVKAFVEQMTKLDNDSIKNFDEKKYNALMASAIMRHEISHCYDFRTASTSTHYPYSFTKALNGEVTSDLSILEQELSSDPDQTLKDIFLYARAVSAFSELSPARTHVTALILNARKHGTEEPTIEDVYYANIHLHELVNRELDAYTELLVPGNYPQSVRNAMLSILEGQDQFMPPLVKKSAELYIEGIDFLTVPLQAKPKPRPEL